MVGYSWVDDHIVQTANQGHGAGLAGRRALLVIIGKPTPFLRPLPRFHFSFPNPRSSSVTYQLFLNKLTNQPLFLFFFAGFTAAFIMMIFPRPNSARALFRRRLAKNMSDIGDLYGKVVTNIENEVDAAEWGKEGTSTHKHIKGEVEGDDVEKRRAQYRGVFLKVMVSFFSSLFLMKGRDEDGESSRLLMRWLKIGKDDGYEAPFILCFVSSLTQPSTFFLLFENPC